MKSPGVLATVVLTCLISACGSGESDSAARPNEPSPTVAEESSPNTRPSRERSVEPSDEVAPWQGDGDPRVLIGTVGEPGDAEAFTISLTDSSGEPVSRIPPGAYRLRVTDPARYHNFHLTGRGVDKRTSIFGRAKVQWNLRLRPGRYTFVCDPHPEMSGNVVVTVGG